MVGGIENEGERRRSGDRRSRRWLACRISSATAASRCSEQADAEKDELYKQIGQLKVELDFSKKRAGLID